MRPHPAIIALLLFGFSAAQSWAFTDNTCPNLKSFNHTPFVQTDKGAPRREWFEMRWVGDWMDFDKGWHLECTHSDNAAAARVCAWLVENTSYEFPVNLPVRLLECNGVKTPKPLAHQDLWISRISLFDEESGRSIILEIALGNHKSPDAVRYSVFGEGADEVLQPLPPLFAATDYTNE